jgi:tripartite-type tricarboxylate transporter receptor subunit TctC
LLLEKTMHMQLHKTDSIGTTCRENRLRKTLRWIPLMVLAFAGLSHAQTWPTRPVRIVVPVSPGGTTDLLARAVGEALSKSLGQPFVIDSKPGAAGSIGSLEVARAPNDGYTLLAGTSSTHAVNPAITPTLKYKAVEDFTPIALLAEANNLLLVSPSVGVKDMKELLAVARQKPGELNYASSGIGSFGHLAFEALGAQAGVKFTHVPYKGTAAAMADLMGGTIQMAVDAVPSALPYVKDGRLRGAAVTGTRRSTLAPDIATVAESGVPGFSVLSWFGLYAPRGLPPQLARRINEEVNKVLHTPEMVARFSAMGIDPGTGSPEEFAAMVAKDTARWAKLAKDLNLKVD